MQKKVSKAIGVYERQGFKSMFKKIALHAAERPYQKVKPKTITLYIDEVGATFDREPTSLINYDFIDDFEAEKKVLQGFLSDLKPSDVFYDIGANVGLYSVFSVSGANPEAVVAFEPHPESARLLRKNSSLNADQITIRELALSDSAGQATLESNPPTGHMLQTNGSDGIKVMMKRGDEVVKKEDIPRPSFIKVDVEGAEMSVLRGFKTVLKSQKLRCIYCEVHPHKSDSNQLEQTIREFLEDIGFRVSALDVDERRTTLRGIKNQ